MIRLVVADVGHTLGVFEQPGTTEVLKNLSPVPESVIREEERRVLHRTPALTDEAIQDLCDALLIRREDWPQSWPDSRFTAFGYAMPVLTELVSVAPVVTLSNIGVTCGPQRMRDLHEQCGDLLSGIYTSYGLGCRKPAPRLWRYIGDEHSVRTEEMVHVGDRWTNDVCGAVAAGARAILLSHTRDPGPEVPPVRDWPAGSDRIAVVDDLRQVPDVLARWRTA